MRCGRACRPTRAYRPPPSPPPNEAHPRHPFSADRAMSREPEAAADVTMPGMVPELITPDALHAPLGGAAPIPASAVASIIALGCVALLMMGIQPLVLGALQSAGRLSVPNMGQAATAE